MADQGEQRRLAAILVADIVGYSRLMEADESGTIARQRTHRAELIDPSIAEHQGRIVKLMGDGILVEFASVVDSIRCAVAIQQAMAERETDLPEDQRIRYRIGINVGDIVIDGDDILGDGVNVAARLEGLAEPGGIAISGNAHEYVRGKPAIAFVDGGTHVVKNIARPIPVWFWRGNETPETTTAPETPQDIDQSPKAPLDWTKQPSQAVDSIRQEIRYCTGSDGTALAYATAGQGPPLFKAQHFMTHLEHDWHSPTFGPFYREMAANYQFVRHDQRGNGLSERNPVDISFECFVQDFGVVADATGIERFPIYGLSQGAAVAVAYAARHPERVSALILQGGYVRGRFKRGVMSDDERAKVDALITLIRTGWGQDHPAFRHMFTTMFIPGATIEQMDSFDEMMRVATEPDVAARIFKINAQIDVSDITHRVQAPTLILHSRSDAVSPFDEGRRLAASIPDAQLVVLDSPNHITLHDEPAMPRVIAEIKRFLAEHPA